MYASLCFLPRIFISRPLDLVSNGHCVLDLAFLFLFSLESVWSLFCGHDVYPCSRIGAFWLIRWLRSDLGWSLTFVFSTLFFSSILCVFYSNLFFSLKIHEKIFYHMFLVHLFTSLIFLLVILPYFYCIIFLFSSHISFYIFRLLYYFFYYYHFSVYLEVDVIYLFLVLYFFIMQDSRM